MIFWAEWLKAILYGIVEGITEWLPVSSTGHLILLGDRLPFAFSGDPVFLNEFRELFDVWIQIGAVLAVVLRYRKKLFSPLVGSPAERADGRHLWGKILLASLPAAFVGIILDRLLTVWTGKDLDAWCFRPPVVAAMLILYGAAFLLVEKFRKPVPGSADPSRVGAGTALGIGAAQALSVVPGTSRSGATILGALLLGLPRKTGAEFSFFLAVPAMFGAGAVKLLGFCRYLAESGTAVPGISWGILAVGCAVSFAVSMISISFLMSFVEKHSFRGFGIYRILLGILVLILL